MRVGSENNHDRLPKTLLDHGGPGCSPPGGENAAPELDEALDCIMSSPYIAPYIGKNLIQHLVTSNPSPTYVSDVSTAFTTGSFTDPASGVTFGSGTVGDMQAVIAAILLDAEARGDTTPSSYAGHLKEPVLFITNLLRAFNTTSAGNTTDNVLGESFLPSDVVMSEDVYRSPSVFNFFPPGNAIAGENSCGISGSAPCLGPEFGIQDTSTSLARVNLAYEIVFHQMPTNTNRPMGTWIDENTLSTLGANDPQPLVDTLNSQMMHGSMTSDMNARIVSAVSAITNADPAVQALSRAREAVYLIASSSEYNVGRILNKHSNPVTTVSVTGLVGNNGWYRGPATVTLTATDPDSPVAATYFGVDEVPTSTYSAPFIISNDGIHQVSFYSIARAGNREEVNQLQIQIDQTPPAISGMPAAGCMLWPPNHKMVQVGLIAATDGLSGLAPGSLNVTGTSGM
jgi:hypothetical protein